MKMTDARWRMLQDVVRDGERRYNGRALPVIEALVDAGFVTDDWHLEPHADGKYTELHTVRPTEAGRAVVS
jgi:hypothetical protein